MPEECNLGRRSAEGSGRDSQSWPDFSVSAGRYGKVREGSHVD